MGMAGQHSSHGKEGQKLRVGVAVGARRTTYARVTMYRTLMIAGIVVFGALPRLVFGYW